MFILKKGNQPGVYVPRRTLFLVYDVFMIFPPFPRFSTILMNLMNMHDHGMKGLNQGFKLVPYSEV